eukprot:CFRG2978T1
MSKHAAALQAYNNDLVKGISEIKERRRKLEKEVEKDQAESDELHAELAILTGKIDVVKARLDAKQRKLDDVDKKIKQTEGAYLKIIESSQTLLEVLKRAVIDHDSEESDCL